VPMINTLQFRNRFENGLQLIDEENLTWDECLHRYDDLESLIAATPQKNPYFKQPDFMLPKDEPIISIIDSLYAHKTINHRSKLLRRQGIELLDQVVTPPKNWNGSKSDDYFA